MIIDTSSSSKGVWLTSFSPAHSHSPSIVADAGELFSVLLPEGLDEVLRDPTQPKPSHQQLGSIRDVFHTLPGVLVEHGTAGAAAGEGPLARVWQRCVGQLLTEGLRLCLTCCLMEALLARRLQFSFLR